MVEPRRIAAISLASRVASELNEVLGESVGHAVRFDQILPRNGGITFTTPGTLLKIMRGDPLLSVYSHIIIDEVHERDANTDLILCFLRELLPHRPDLRLVLMSALANVNIYHAYFGHQLALVTVPGSLYSVKEYFLEDVDKLVGMPKNTEAASSDLAVPYPLLEELVVHIINYLGDGGILCFLPGWEEIRALQKQLAESPKLSAHPISLILLHSSVPSSEQHLVFQPVKIGARKIVLATNIAETSITIP